MSTLNSLMIPHPQERGDAEELAKKVRVLCWVMTGPANHKTKAAHVKVNPAMSSFTNVTATFFPQHL